MFRELEPPAILSYIFSCLAIILNGVLLISMFNERKKIFVTRISYLVANLAFVDCLNGVFLIALLQPIPNIRFLQTEAMFTVQLPLVWTAFCASYFTLFLMAAERLIIVTLPLLWSTLLTVRRTIYCICMVWIISIAAGIAIHYVRFYALFFICLFVEICALSFIATHVYILWILHKREKRRVKTFAIQDSSQITPCLPEPSSENIAHKKVTVVVTILLIVLVVTCVPYFICLQIFSIANTFDPTVRNKLDRDTYRTAYIYTDAFNYIYFFSNPIIYAWRLTMYRQAFYSLLTRITS